jgi:glycosyltransferase involved in cell wall biosynthesis
MHWIFIDLIEWDYDVATPLVRPLGGSQSALCYLATALAERGHQVTTLTGISQPRQVGRVMCLAHRQLPPTLFGTAATVVVLLNGPADGAVQIRPLLPAGVPLVLWTQHAHDQPAMRPLAHPACPGLWDRIVCISQWQRSMFAQQLGVPAGHIEVVRNAIGPAFRGLFRDLEEFERAKSGPPRLAYTSTPFRGLELLLSCFPAIRQQQPECQLDVFSSMRVYGAEGAQDAFQHLYSVCRLMEGVNYQGSFAQPELAERMLGVSVLAYPNIFPETCCIAALEALAAGAIVVTSDLAALPETCAGYGRLVPPISETRSRAEYERDFVAAVSAALCELRDDRAALVTRQLEQVRAVNATQTWEQRAIEWEEAGARWVAQRAR